MRTWVETHREGTNVGPVDWEHPTAKAKPAWWKDVERNPTDYVINKTGFTDFKIVEICSYDGWPYWVPRPAIAYVGPMGNVEWAFFDSYDVDDHCIRKLVRW